MFAEYLQPLTQWIQAHPHWAILFTFLISFAESLAIIGSIVPGSVTMTAIGILAGSGVMRIDLTVIAATLGAVVGDSASYTLGYTFRNKLVTIWPFSRYPNWLKFGKDYFAKHGGKSVLIGRFIGPLRSIIPVIAGMMHMNRWHFLVANVISACGWSILYVLPGILIGIASSELSAESASRLFILVIILLLITWAVGITLKWMFKHVNLFLSINLHHFWLWSKKHPRLAHYFDWLTPDNEHNHYPTASLLIIFLFSLCISIILSLIVIQDSWVIAINQPIYLFLQSLRTNWFDVFFMLVNLFSSPLALFSLILAITLYSLYFKDWRTLRFWLSLVLSCSLIVFFFSYTVEVPETEDLIQYGIKLSYPSPTLTFATALFGFLIFYINTRYRTIPTIIVRIFMLLLLFLSGIGLMYLGDNWFTGVLGGYAIGLTICLLHWIIYRRINQSSLRSQLPIVFSFLVLVLATLLSYLLYFKTLVLIHRPVYQQYVVSNNAWWYQKQPLLPLYATNRIGKRTGMFNLQYVGSIKKLEAALTSYGWAKEPSSLFYSFILRAGGVDKVNIPITTQLYLNKKPSLIMTYKSNDNSPLLVIRLWRSNYYLDNYSQPIWLGSLQYHLTKIPTQLNTPTGDVFSHIIPALYGFKFNQINVNNIEPLPQTVSPNLLFIKGPNLNKE